MRESDLNKANVAVSRAGQVLGSSVLHAQSDIRDRDGRTCMFDQRCRRFNRGRCILDDPLLPLRITSIRDVVFIDGHSSSEIVITRPIMNTIVIEPRHGRLSRTAEWTVSDIR